MRWAGTSIGIASIPVSPPMHCQTISRDTAPSSSALESTLRAWSVSGLGGSSTSPSPGVRRVIVSTLPMLLVLLRHDVDPVPADLAQFSVESDSRHPPSRTKAHSCPPSILGGRRRKALNPHRPDFCRGGSVDVAKEELAVNGLSPVFCP